MHPTKTPIRRFTPAQFVEPLEPRSLLAADLAVSFQGKLPTTIPTTGNTAVTLRILNTGPAKATGRVALDLYASLDPTLDSTGDLKLLPTKKLNVSLAKNASTNIPVTFKPPKTLADGDYYLIAVIVPAGAIADTNNSNDVTPSDRTLNYRKPYVDLTAQVTAAPTSTITIGSKPAPATITVAVKNTGNATAKGNLAISVFASSDSAFNADPNDPDTQIMKLPAKPINIAPGATSTFTINTKNLPKSTPSGTFYAVALIQPTKTIKDLRAFNNDGASKKRFKIKNPNLPALPTGPSLEKPGPTPGLITLSSLSPTTFNPVSSPIVLNLSSGAFNLDPSTITITINTTTLPSSNLTITPTSITAPAGLFPGRNIITLTASQSDTSLPLHFTQTIWAGSSTLTVNLKNPDSTPFTSPATLTATLGDDETVTASATSSAGVAVFNNIPDRTILLRAQGPAGEFGVIGAIGTTPSVNLTLTPLGTPSTVDNNDFSTGTLDGWTVSGPSVTVVTHSDPPSITPANDADPSNDTASLLKKPAENPPDGPPKTNYDLIVGTSAEGESFASRTFHTDPGTSSVSVRYRFVTSEVPGGYLGSRYNDYYRISLRSLSRNVSATNTMNGLGGHSFHGGSGSTQWYELVLPVDPKGDTVRIDSVAANVADDAYDSQLHVNAVVENKSNIEPKLAWNKTKGGLDLSARITGSPLTENKVVRVFFATGTAASSATKQVYSYTAPKGTKAGNHGNFHIPGSLLQNAPPNTSHILAIVDDTVFPLPDVALTFGATANPDAVSNPTRRALKDFARAAGLSTLNITSTARTPADQARAMFTNLTNPNRSLQDNIQSQLNLYAPPGDQVVHAFASRTQSLSADQIRAQSTSIQDFMASSIRTIGPSRVSNHCVDPTTLNVIDLGYSNFTGNASTLFRDAAQADPRLSKLLNEPDNKCYHLEFPQSTTPPT